MRLEYINTNKQRVKSLPLVRGVVHTQGNNELNPWSLVMCNYLSGVHTLVNSGLYPWPLVICNTWVLFIPLATGQRCGLYSVIPCAMIMCDTWVGFIL